MANYCMTVGGQDYELRLTAKAQVNLEDKFKTPIAGLLGDAIDKAQVRAEMFKAALNWNGNRNPITDGYGFCDALVDDGVAGQEKWAEIICDLNVASGIISAATRDEIMNRVRGVFENIGEDDEENPTTMD